jgi:penicillin-binding protein 2
MKKVVNGDHGTARAARSKEFETAGKTGTAQAWRVDPKSKERIEDNKTWFIAFAPYDRPKYAVCVFVEHGTSGGGTVAPIAARIIKQAVAVDAGTYSPPVQSLAEVAGHFKKLDKTVYADDPVDAALAAQQGNEDENVTASEPPPRTTAKTRKIQMAQPKIKSKANAEGSNVSNREPSPPPTPAKRNFFRRLFNFGQ